MILPKKVQDLFNDPMTIKVLATRSPEGVIHAIPVGSLCAPDPNTITCAPILMKEAHRNLESAMKTGELVSALAVKVDREKNISLSFQGRCTVKSFDKAGPIYTTLRGSLKKRGFDVHGAWILEPVEAINQSPGPEAEKKIT